jgi:hypothetical protein
VRETSERPSARIGVSAYLAVILGYVVWLTVALWIGLAAVSWSSSNPPATWSALAAIVAGGVLWFGWIILIVNLPVAAVTVWLVARLRNVSRLLAIVLAGLAWSAWWGLGSLVIVDPDPRSISPLTPAALVVGGAVVGAGFGLFCLAEYGPDRHRRGSRLTSAALWIALACVMVVGIAAQART